jgi:hypothetical protein
MRPGFQTSLIFPAGTPLEIDPRLKAWPRWTSPAALQLRFDQNDIHHATLAGSGVHVL